MKNEYVETHSNKAEEDRLVTKISDIEIKELKRVSEWSEIPFEQLKRFWELTNKITTN